MPKYLSLLLIYPLFFTTFLGVSIVYFTGFDFGRLGGVSLDTKDLVFYHVLYSMVVLLFVIFVAVICNRGREGRAFSEFFYESPKRYKLFAMLLLAFNGIYLLSLIVAHKDSLPLLILLQGGSIDYALEQAKLQHLSAGAVNIPYVSKFFDFSNLFLPLFLLLLYFRKSIGIVFLGLSYGFAFFYLSLDLQKAPFLMLCVLSFYLVVILSDSIGKIFFRVLIFLLMAGFVLYLYSFFMGKDFFEMLLYAFDRPVLGQIQGMYYMYEYYPPSMDAVFSKFFFSAGGAAANIPPDVYIVDYIYPDSPHVVNVNTYFVGEAWAFGGDFGVLFFSWAVALSLGFYIFFWSRVIGWHVHVSYIMALVFFATLPINQSLQFVMYQKYFLYYVIFFVLPVFLLLRLMRVNGK